MNHESDNERREMIKKKQSENRGWHKQSIIPPGESYDLRKSDCRQTILLTQKVQWGRPGCRFGSSSFLQLHKGQTPAVQMPEKSASATCRLSGLRKVGSRGGSPSDKDSLKLRPLGLYWFVQMADKPAVDSGFLWQQCCHWTHAAFCGGVMFSNVSLTINGICTH